MNKSISLFQRSNSIGILKELDGLRFFSIFFVALSHLLVAILKIYPQLDKEILKKENYIYLIASKGPAGVNLFFVISGFVLALNFINVDFKMNLQNLLDFYRKRFCRIIPAFWVALILVYFLNLAIGLVPNVDMKHFFASATLIHGIVFNEWSRIFPVSWSLEMELQFYLLAPFIFYIYFGIKNKLRPLYLVLIILALPSLLAFFMPYGEILRYTVLNFLQYFLVGLGCADLYKNWNFKNKETIGLAFFVVGVIAIIFFLQKGIVFKTFFPISLGLFLLGVTFNDNIKKKLSSNFLPEIGVMSYSIYLLHFQIIYFFVLIFEKIFILNNFNQIFILYGVIIFPLIAFCCGLYFFIIERPLRIFCRLNVLNFK